MARAIPFNQKIADDICGRLVNGESLRKICLDEDKPSTALVCRWLGEHATFRDQYARAREAQADTITDEILHISDNTEMGTETTTKADGSTETRVGDMLGHRRLKIDARKWYASKLAPKKYGEKIELASDPENPVTGIVVQIVDPKHGA